ncbi:MAG: anaerobic sulfite reductase subunit AsrA [Lachnospiraceae bacterium]|nr:anaerobic sulfite reductase subunit AsrA [Lachnospiraceae bacterium]
MGVLLTKKAADEIFSQWVKKYDVYAPMVMEGEGCFSDTDCVRYGKPASLDDIEWNRKSEYSFKEVLLAINETIFYFTENQTTIPEGPKKDIVIFLRACDLNALKRLDQIYLDNKFGDFYYARVRERAKFVLMGCSESCASGFCVSMGTNKADNYDLSLKVEGEAVYADVKDSVFDELTAAGASCDFQPDFVTENKEKVTVPKHPEAIGKDAEIWKEYGSRCINCGRCNFACPTCTCFTMQDIFYNDNPKAGERRRVWASCQVDDFDSIAGGIKFRKDNADRVRYKVLHKVYDFEKRFGYPMCVGCGRCDDICPEYISYSNLLNRLAKEEEK